MARIGTLLPDPVAVTVVDEAGQPLRGERVQWRTNDGGRIAPFNTVTDENGMSRARWILGSTEGVRTATASLSGAEPAVITAIAESPDALPFDLPAVLDIPTFDGSGQLVHPDYAATPQGRLPPRIISRSLHIPGAMRNSRTPRSSSPRRGSISGRSGRVHRTRSFARRPGISRIPTCYTSLTRKSSGCITGRLQATTSSCCSARRTELIGACRSK